MSATRVFRVDPRLVHATLMNAWVPAVGATQIIVADRITEEDPRLKTIMQMSAMDQVRLTFTNEESVYAILAGLPATAPVIVLFTSVQTAERAVIAGLKLDELNIGHLPEAPGRRPVLPAVHLGDEDLAVVRRLKERGVEVYLQPLPRDPRCSPFATPISLAPPSSSGEYMAMSATPLPRVTDRRTPLPGTLSAVPPPENCARAKLRVVNERGLHLRAAHALVQLASTLTEQEVRVGRHGELVNAKSLLGLTTLGAGCGALVEVIVTGPHAADAMAQIKDLFDNGFDEDVAYTGVDGEDEDDAT